MVVSAAPHPFMDKTHLAGTRQYARVVMEKQLCISPSLLDSIRETFVFKPVAPPIPVGYMGVFPAGSDQFRTPCQACLSWQLAHHTLL
jgi:hypothetical protein